MSQNETDNRNVEHRIESLLSDAQAAAEAADEDDAEALRDVAGGVHFLVEAADTTTLLEAAGVDFAGDATPDSIPEAIARTDSDSVIDLRFLLLLSRLSEREGEEAAAIADDLRELAAKRADRKAPEEEGGAAADAEAEQETEVDAEAETEADAEPKPESAAESETEAEAETEGEPAVEAESAEATDAGGEAAEGKAAEAEGAGAEPEGEAADAKAEAADAEAEAESDEGSRFERFESTIESHLGEGIGGFREEIDSARTALEERLGDEEEEADGAEATDEDRDERETGRRLSTGGGTGTFSTMPSTPRRDMNTPRRLSTVRRK